MAFAVGDTVRDRADPRRVGSVHSLPGWTDGYNVKWHDGPITSLAERLLEPAPTCRWNKRNCGALAHPDYGGFCEHHGKIFAKQAKCRDADCWRNGDTNRYGYCDLHFGPAECDCGHAMHRHGVDGDRPCADCSCVNPEIVPYDAEAITAGDDREQITRDLRADEISECRPTLQLWSLAQHRARELGVEIEWDVAVEISDEKVSSGPPVVMGRALKLTVRPPRREPYHVYGNPSRRSASELTWTAMLRNAGILGPQA